MKLQSWPKVYRSHLMQVKSLFDQAEQFIAEGRCDQARTYLEFLLKMLHALFEGETHCYRPMPPTWALHQMIFQTYLRIGMLPATVAEAEGWNKGKRPADNVRLNTQQLNSCLFSGIQNLALAHVSPALDWPARIALCCAIGLRIGL